MLLCMPAAQEEKDALPPPALPHSPALATAGNDVLEGFVCDGSPGCLETGNIPNLDSSMTSSCPPTPSFADVVVRRSCKVFQCLLLKFTRCWFKKKKSRKQGQEDAPSGKLNHPLSGQLGREAGTCATLTPGSAAQRCTQT